MNNNFEIFSPTDSAEGPAFTFRDLVSILFKQAGLDYATTLLGIRFKMEKRPNGVSVIRLTSDKPINDPFVDMLLELNWPAGRLVREYTFLLDPPEMAVKAAAPVASAIAKPVVSGKPRVEQQPTAVINEETRSKAAVKAQAQASAPATAQKQVAQSAGEQDTREVRRGETLNKIAIETKPEGVSLEQMLVGLLRANQDAFDGGNMNRLKAGRILSVPDRSALEAVSLGEAKKIVAAQSADWNAYRSKLAGIAAQTPVKEGDAKQEAAGKITAKVEDKAVPVEAPKDQLKVSIFSVHCAKFVPGVWARTSGRTRREITVDDGRKVRRYFGKVAELPILLNLASPQGKVSYICG